MSGIYLDCTEMLNRLTIFSAVVCAARDEMQMQQQIATECAFCIKHCASSVVSLPALGMRDNKVETFNQKFCLFNTVSDFTDRGRCGYRTFVPIISFITVHYSNTVYLNSE